MNFGEALEAVKQGKPISRKGWNGKGMFVYLVPAATYNSMTNIAKMAFGDTTDYNPYFSIKNVDNTVSTWVPSVNDILAEDWEIAILEVSNNKLNNKDIPLPGSVAVPMHKIDSGDLEYVGWQDNILYIKFYNKVLYKYLNVSEIIFNNMMGMTNKYAYFHGHIKNKYKRVKD